MSIRFCAEAVDLTLPAVMKSTNVQFCREYIPLCDDFRSIVPVVRRGSRGAIVFMILKSYPLFGIPLLVELVNKMRLKLV